jgi:leader peptidase (prepilin peptidase) / N-methyltransferase
VEISMFPAEMLTSPLTWVWFVFGAMIGSFLNVCIVRIPDGSFFKNARSVCPHCGAGIPAYHNIPILTWFILKGRAACCKSSISIRYMLVEFITAALFVIIYWKFPFLVSTSSSYIVDHGELIRCLHAMLFSSLLIICSFIDLKHMIIPDAISLGMVVVTPLIVIVHPELNWVDAGIGVFVGGFSLYAIAWIYFLLRSEVGMGMGDVKLLAAIGGWLGYQAIIPTIFYGSILGSFFGLFGIILSGKLDLKTAIPFGPFLALGAIIHLVLGSWIQMVLAGAQ